MGDVEKLLNADEFIGDVERLAEKVRNPDNVEYALIILGDSDGNRFYSWVGDNEKLVANLERMKTKILIEENCGKLDD